jgi:hypothetical protein
MYHAEDVVVVEDVVAEDNVIYGEVKSTVNLNQSIQRHTVNRTKSRIIKI